MNGALSSEDASQESFARILGRLTRAPGRESAGFAADAGALHEDEVSLSISQEAVAALDGSRKRAMVPVREARMGKAAREAGEISYERALHRHARRSVGEAASSAVKTEAKSAGQVPEPPATRAQAEKKAISALRKAKSRLAEARGTEAGSATDPRGKRERTKAAVSSGVALAGEDAELREGVASHSSGISAESREPLPADPSSPRRRKPTRATGTSPADKPERLSSAAHPAGEILPARPRSQGKRRGTDNTHRNKAPVVRAGRSPGLEAASPLAIAQRQSSISIRLSTVEAEQLRQRAAESGISVSAYMRSCVLEAEHLRTQVKQALVELRAAHAVAPTPKIEPQPLFAAVYQPEQTGSRALRSGFVGFLSGAFALVLGRFHR